MVPLQFTFVLVLNIQIMSVPKLIAASSNLFVENQLPKIKQSFIVPFMYIWGNPFVSSTILFVQASAYTRSRW